MQVETNFIFIRKMALLKFGESIIMEPRISIVTLGVKNIQQSYDFYSKIVEFMSDKGIEGDIVFFNLQHMQLALYPKDKLAEDAGVPNEGTGFAGITLAHNVKNKEEVDSIIEKVRKAGVKITKEPQETFWGGYDAYFQDLDGYLWEVAWNPFFHFE
jgi:catechol 2,3-dioxygenase-like lactoylglutathione lyase family enzyme